MSLSLFFFFIYWIWFSGSRPPEIGLSPKRVRLGRAGGKQNTLLPVHFPAFEKERERRDGESRAKNKSFPFMNARRGASNEALRISEIVRLGDAAHEGVPKYHSCSARLGVITEGTNGIGYLLVS